MSSSFLSICAPRLLRMPWLVVARVSQRGTYERFCLGGLRLRTGGGCGVHGFLSLAHLNCDCQRSKRAALEQSTLTSRILRRRQCCLLARCISLWQRRMSGRPCGRCVPPLRPCRSSVEFNGRSSWSGTEQRLAFRLRSASRSALALTQPQTGVLTIANTQTDNLRIVQDETNSNSNSARWNHASSWPRGKG